MVGLTLGIGFQFWWYALFLIIKMHNLKIRRLLILLHIKSHTEKPINLRVIQLVVSIRKPPEDTYFGTINQKTNRLPLEFLYGVDQ